MTSVFFFLNKENWKQNIEGNDQIKKEGERDKYKRFQI